MSLDTCSYSDSKDSLLVAHRVRWPSLVFENFWVHGILERQNVHVADGIGTAEESAMLALHREVTEHWHQAHVGLPNSGGSRTNVEIA